MKTSTAYPVYWITSQLATGPAPMSYDHLEYLKSQGVGAIMNLCAEYCDLHSIESKEGFEVYYLPVEDEEAPQLQALENALAWLDEAIYLGKKVYVHCRHGIGRTGTVISAYLLRRGLGSKLVKEKVKNMRSQPSNFNQWWFLRKMGKKEGKLTIREPSLEWKSLVDLSPFFNDYEQLLETVDRRLEEQNTRAYCGRDHTACCTRYVEVGLIEAAYLTHGFNRRLGSEDRLAAIQRAVEVSRNIRSLAKTVGNEERETDFADLYAKKNLLCPLSLGQQCLAYESRPLACRFADLGQTEEDKAFSESCREKAEELSKGLFLALCGSFSGPGKIVFPLVDVVSGKFVQAFFNILSCTIEPSDSRGNAAGIVKPGSPP